MLTICLGPNGSGKSLWAMHQLERALLNDNRPIVTSLAVDVPALNEYMQRKYQGRAPDVTNRVWLLEKDQQRTFWRYRSTEFDAYYGRIFAPRGPFGDESWRQPDGGRIFILDEIQTTFGARDWQKTGPEFVAYQSQHRKASDDVIAIAPASSLVDKQFRVLFGECVVLQNMYQLRVGWVKAPRKIVCRTYANCPPAQGEDQLTKEDIYIDAKAIAGCYRTQDGLGFCGSNADKGREAKGIPLKMVFVGLGCASIVAYFGIRAAFDWGTRATVSWIGKPGRKMAEQVAGLPVPSAVAAPVAVMPMFGNIGPSPVLAAAKAPVVVPVAVVADEIPEAGGWARVGGRVALDTDCGLIWGTKLEEKGRYLFLDGEKYRRRMVGSSVLARVKP